MRRGLMLWREDELGVADVRDRQQRTGRAVLDAGFDALLVYTNHVRPAGVAYLTGFTPYWSDAILLVLPGQAPVFSTALSKRVGNWIHSVNPTAEILHSPQPGRAIGERLAAAGAKRIGVVELDRMPGGLCDEILSAGPVELVDATAVFTKVRGMADPAELALAAQADDLARRVLAAVDRRSATVGEVAGPLERAVRLAGAEECYVAIAPDLAADGRLARIDGRLALGDRFAVRLSVACNGTWIRRTQSFARSDAGQTGIDRANQWFEAVASAFDPRRAVGPQLAIRPEGLDLQAWTLEAPWGTRPLKVVASPEQEPADPIPYGVLAVALRSEEGPVLACAPVALAGEGHP